jgi:hypothetical protein
MSASSPRPRPPRRDECGAGRSGPAVELDVDVEEAPLGLSLGILSLSGAARRG